MSRVIVHVGRARPAAGLLFVVGPAGAGRVDGVGGQDLAGGEVDDGGGGLVDEYQDWGSAVVGTDADVMHVSGAAKRDLAVGADVVEAQPVVPGDGGACGSGFGSGVVGGA